MTHEQVTKLREIESRATPGTWQSAASPDPGRGISVEAAETGETVARSAGSAFSMSIDPTKCWSRSLRKARADAALIAASRNALPKLLDEIEAQAKEIESLRIENASLRLANKEPYTRQGDVAMNIWETLDGLICLRYMFDLQLNRHVGTIGFQDQTGRKR